MRCQHLIWIFINFIYFAYADFCTKNDCTPKAFQVKISKNSEYSYKPIEYRETEASNQCWRYTWLGPVNDKVRILKKKIPLCKYFSKT